MEINLRVWRLKNYKFYPKANYLRKRILSFWPRFNNVINSFPERFHVDWEKDAIDEEALTYKRDCEITVTFSEKLPLNKFIISEGHEYTTELLDEPSGPASDNKGFCISLIYISIQDTGRGNEIIETMICAFKSSMDAGHNNQEYVYHTFVICDVSAEADDQAVSNFRNLINSHMFSKVSSDWPGEGHIVIGPDSITLGSKISIHLEKAILDTFLKMYRYLDRFVYKGQPNCSHIKDVAHVEEVETALLNYLRYGLNSPDLNKQLIEEADLSNEDQVVEIVMDDMMKKLKCVIGSPIAKKLSMKLVIVYLCLDEINFGKIIKENISKVTQMQLIRSVIDMQQNKQVYEHARTRKSVYTKNDFLRYGLQNDLSTAFRVIEKDLKKADKTIDIMGKLQFEIEGNFKVFGQEEKSFPKKPAKLSQGLTDELKQTNGVVGFGTIYGKLEIHVKRGTSQLPIDDALCRHKYDRNYAVKTVAKEATSYASIQYEQGNDILCPWADSNTNGHKRGKRKGTIGLFVESQTTEEDNKKVYALTCAHVVSTSHIPELEVFVIGRSLILRRLGVSTPLMTICTRQVDDSHLIDIAAVKVDANMEDDCIRYVKDEEGMPKRARINWETNVEDLEKIYVYKYGAKSRLTYGIICSSEYIKKINKDLGTDYIVLVDKLPGMERPFAEEGDSGSVVCAPCLDSEKHVELHAMLSGGGLTLEDDPSTYCLTFQLTKGLRALEKQSGVKLMIQ